MISPAPASQLASSGSRPAVSRRAWLAALAGGLALVAAGGWWVAEAEAGAVDRALRQGIAAQAHSLARALPAEQVAQLAFAPADADAPIYRRLSAQLHAYAGASGVRCIYTVAQRGDRLVFGPESPLPGDPLASPPGQSYEAPPAGLAEALAAGRPLVVGPYRDEFGTFVSAFAPVRDARTGAVACLVGVDAEADDWDAALAAARIRPLAAVLLIALALLAGAWAARPGQRRRGLRRQAEILVAAAIGLILAVAVGLAVRDLVRRHQDEQVEQAASVLATRVVDGLAGLRRQVLPALAERLAEESGERGSERLARRAAGLLANPLVEAVWWVAPRLGDPGWEVRAGAPAGAGAPPAPQLEAALLAAQGSGLPAASQPLPQSGADPAPVLVAHPVLAPGPAALPSGALVVQLRPARCLTSLFDDRWCGVGHDAVSLDPIVPGLAPRDEAAGRPAYRPVFAFGRAWRLSVAADPGGAAAGWTAGLLTAVVAALATASVGMMAVRRLGLERQVRLRTSELEAQRNRYRDGEYHLRAVLDATGAALWEWDLAARNLRVDARGWAMLGCLGDAPGGTSSAWWSRCHPEDLARSEDLVAACLAGSAAVYDCELRLRHQDGSWRWLRCRGTLVAAAGGGDARRLCGTIVDITARRQATEQLERQARTQAVLVELASGFVNTPVDRLDGAIEAALAIVGTLVGIDRCYLFIYDHVAGTMGCTHEWCGPGIGSELESCQRLPIALVPGMLAAHQRGEPFQVADSAALAPASPLRALLDAQGVRALVTMPLRLGEDCLGFVGFDAVRSAEVGGDDQLALLRVLAELFANALARRARERALVEARRTAESAAAARSAFLANMSHEIRTPMNGVLGMTQLLLDTRLDGEQEDYVRTLLRSGQALLTILNDILDFSRIESGRLQLERIPFDLRQAVHDVAELFRSRCAEAGVELHLAVEPGLPRRVVGDPARIRQILANLVGNAVKFTAAGHVAVRLEARGSRLSLVVEDTGVGIPPERQAMLFQPFVQADVSTTRQYGGTGLGLSICRRLCELMGGGISLVSVPGAGTTVSVDLPLDPAADGQGASASPQVLAGRRVLVVERSARGRAITCDHLAWLGLRPLGVADHDLALTELRREAAEAPFALVLIEVPPGGAAVDAAIPALRLAAGGARLVALSGGGIKGDAAQVAAAGFAGYLTRPLDPDLLGRVLAAVLDPQRAADAPLVTQHSVREAQEAEPAARMEVRPGLDVLVAEDQAVNRTLIGHLLARWQARVTIVEDGAAAVARSGERSYDLVLMDVQMPLLDGLEATRAIRAAEAGGGRRVPIIALTADAMPEDRQRCREAGMDDHLAKPILERELAAVLARWGGTARPA